MKTFEEKFTAWVDGKLTGQELVEFEASLPDRAAAEAEKRALLKLGAFLKEQLAPQPFANEEFFSNQIREHIARHQSGQDRSAFAWLRRDTHGARSTWWTIPRLAWCGAAAIALFVLFSVMFVRDNAPESHSPYLTQILNARVDPNENPNATITMFERQQNGDERVTVLWTEGLKSLPSEFASK
jgi:anti-sigma factor RsiW